MPERYSLQDTILSSGRKNGWEIKGGGINAAFLFEYMTAKRSTMGGIFQTGIVYTFEGSRISAYEKAGYKIRGVYTETLGVRVGYGF